LYALKALYIAFSLVVVVVVLELLEGLLELGVSVMVDIGGVWVSVVDEVIGEVSGGTLAIFKPWFTFTLI
jgi:hypothetical protein